MTNEEVFAAWSPEDSPWSTWVKPVLFAHLHDALILPASSEVRPDLAWAPPETERCALVLDLPGDEGVWMGAELAGLSYRPVPLFNAIPIPVHVLALSSFKPLTLGAVNVFPILSALRLVTAKLSATPVPVTAPPAFLLDANRHGGPTKPTIGMFDNRSVCFTTDFPSANFMRSQGINRVLLVQRKRFEPQTDLAHVLRRWQDGGLILERMRIESPMLREEFQVSRPHWYGTMFQRVLTALGLRRAPSGGFGAWLQDTSSGG